MKIYGLKSNFAQLVGKLMVLIIVVLVAASCSITPDGLEQSLTTSGTLSPDDVISGQWDVVWMPNKAYFVQNDIWNGPAGAQVLNVNAANGDFTVQSCIANLTTAGPPMSYPSIVKGNHYNTVTTGSGMPIKVSSISTLPTKWTITTAAGYWDAAYDIWFQNGAYSGGNYNGAELMIWINHSGPSQPIGSKIATKSINGTSWDIWYGNIGWNVISFIRTTVTTSVNFDIKPFINECVSRGYINTAWNLMAVEAGFEIWKDGAGLKSSGFSVTVNGGTSGGGTGFVTLRKANALSFGVDGGNGGANGQSVYLWSYDRNNVNQQWDQIDRGGGYYSFQKHGTSFCLDGGNGGANGQAVYLWTRSDANQNQHWKKIDLGGGYFRLEKRNAPGFSIDGGNGGANGQALKLWTSDNNNQNQRWLVQ